MSVTSAATRSPALYMNQIYYGLLLRVPLPQTTVYHVRELH